MKSPILIFVLLFTHAFHSYGGTPWDGTVIATAFESGEGTSESPYQIKTAEQFAYFAQYTGSVNEDLLFNTYNGKYFELTDDIDLNNKPFYPVGLASGEQYDPFDGYFDGKNHKIKQLSIKNINNQSPTGGGIGLFANIGTSGKVKNVIIESGEILTSDFQDCGAIAGYNQGLISNCHNYAKVEAASTIILPLPPIDSPSGTPSPYVNTEDGVGGIAGRNTGDGVILQCTNYGEVTNNATVTPNFYTGGIVGYDDITSSRTTIESAVAACVNFGNVSSAYSYVGGVIGKSKNPNKIGFLGNLGEVRTTATTSISAIEKIEVGGIVGRNYEHLQNCMNMGNISGTALIAVTGGVSGNLNTTPSSSLDIHYCYNRGTADFGISPASDRTIGFKNVFYDDEITPKGYGDTNTNNSTVVNAKSSTEMKTNAFLGLLNDTQAPKPWILCTQLNNGYPVMEFMVKKITFSTPATGIIVKTNGQTVTDSVWLGSKVEFSLTAGYQWQSGGTETKVMYAADDIIFTEKAVIYTIKATSNNTASAISIKGSVDNVERNNWTAGETVAGGSTVLLKAVSSVEKYVFVAWKENGTTVSTDVSYTFTASANRTLVAEFKVRYHIKITSSAGGTVTKNSGDWVDEGATVNLTITPDSGYKIKKVTLKSTGEEMDLEFTSIGYVLRLTISSDSDVTVTFEQEGPTGVSDNTIQQSIVYARNHQIFVETFAPSTVIGYNIMGQVIFDSGQEKNVLARYDVSATGLYFVKIVQPQSSIVKKVMVQ